MKNSKFIVAIVVIALLSAFFGVGGTKTASAASSTLADVAGLTAWYNAGAAIDPAAFVSGFSTIEYQTDSLVVGTVDIPVYVDEFNPHVLVDSSGYILAFYPNTDPAAKMVDVMAKTLSTTLLEYAVVIVGAAGDVVVPDVSYYDFSDPDATDMLVLAENRADGENAFSLQMPANFIDVDGDETDTSIYYDYVYYDKSYSFYQTYLPEFTLDTENLEEPVNFVLDNALFIGPGYYGSVFGTFRPDENLEDETDITDLLPGDLNEFTVNSGSTSAFGALVLTYSYTLEGIPTIEGADLMAEFALAAPGTMGETTYELLPGAVTKTSPTDDATGLSLNPTLDWDDSTSPNYEYCVDTVDNDLCDTAWVSTPTDISEVTLSGLLFDTTYYWQVRATNSAGTVDADNGVWFSFTTEAITAPAAFAKLSPLDGTLALSPNSVVLDWNETYGAYSYEYCVSEAQSCTNWVDVGTDTTVTLSNLKFETIYNWQVRAVNDDFNTVADAGVMWSFTTLDSFSKLTPVDGALNQKTRLTLTWERLGAATYEYCIDDTAPGTVPEETDDCGTSWVSMGSTTKVTLRLSYATKYYWQVKANNGTPLVYVYANDDNDPLTSDWWSFTTQAQNTPSRNLQFEKISPQDGATDVFTTVTLKWINVGATLYEYCLYTEVACTEDAWVGVGTATSVTIENLIHGTTYYWQVRGMINGVLTYADRGAFWDFTTTFDKLTPENHSQDQLVNGLTLSWEPVTGATEYQYCFGTDETCADIEFVTNGTETSVEVSGLSYGARYYWQVRANIGTTTVPVWLYANGSPTALWRFTTQDLEKISPENGAIDQPINITLDWGEVEDAIAYEYCLSTDGVCAEWVSTAEASTATITNLSYSTTYYWQVRANVGTVDVPVWLYADGAEATIWSFTTIDDPTVEPLP